MAIKKKVTKKKSADIKKKIVKKSFVRKLASNNNTIKKPEPLKKDEFSKKIKTKKRIESSRKRKGIVSKNTYKAKKKISIPANDAGSIHNISRERKVTRLSDEQGTINRFPMSIEDYSKSIDENKSKNSQKKGGSKFINPKIPNKEVIMRSCILTLEKIVSVCKPISSRQIITHFMLGFLFAFILMIIFVHFGGDRHIARYFAEEDMGDGIFSAYYTVEEDASAFIKTAPNNPKDFSGVDLSEFWEVWRIIESDFVGKPLEGDEDVDILKPYSPTREELIKGAISGLTLATQDRHTNYLDSEVAKDFEDEVLNGSITGIGAYITLSDGLLTIVRPIPNGPAEKAGLKNDDIITAIDGSSVENYTLREATSMIKGERGTEVILNITRSITLEELEIVVIRDEVVIPSVEHMEKDGVFIISLSTFTRQTPKAFADALQEYAKYATYSDDPRILLDMRGNSGGVLSVAVTIAGLFLPSDSVVLYDYDGSEKLRVYRTKSYVFEEGQLPKITILLDGASASATEILAAALRYHNIADIVGTTSVGKGSVQTLHSIGDKNSLLKITVAQWLTPEKKSISDVGVIPDKDFREDLIKARRENPDLDINSYVLDKAIKWLKNK